jgi:hypothetical protein
VAHCEMAARAQLVAFRLCGAGRAIAQC